MISSHRRSTCPDENELVMSLNGLLTPSTRAELERHIDQCDRCCSLVATVVKASVEPEETTEPEPESAAALLPRGTNLGRYVLLDCIGRGGMAVVYAAYDPELDRKVAVKLLRTDLPGAPSELRASLLREAQAMAKLTHPNVIAVYDVGTFNEQVFLAMEFIRGRDLRAWLNESPRSWREILQVFLKAGDGLRAAHESDLAHRDFKPDNVLVGFEGQVRVTDFGLAHRMRVPGDKEPAAATAKDERHSRQSVLAGTPLYIAPEQWRGRRSDERADQFSFCVSLYEALYGERPFAGRTSASYTGEIPEPPEGSSVPSWIRRVLVRGLSMAPEDRYPSIADLLNALSHGLLARRYRTWLAGAAALLLVVAFAVESAVEASAMRAVELDLARGTELFRVKGAQLQKEVDLQADRATNQMYLLEALGKADDVDTTLGLAQEPEEQGLAFAHDLIRSADLPSLADKDVILFVDVQGRVIYDRADETTHGQKLAGVDIVDRALAGQSVEALWSPLQVRSSPVQLSARIPDDDLLLLFARPITRGPKRLGALFVGRWVKGWFLPSLEKMVGDRVVLRGPDRTQAATLNTDLKAIEQLDGSPTPTLQKLGAQRFLVQSVDLVGFSGQPLGSAFLLRNYDQEVKPILSRSRRDTLKFGMLAMAVPLVLYAVWRARSLRSWRRQPAT